MNSTQVMPIDPNKISAIFSDREYDRIGPATGPLLIICRTVPALHSLYTFPLSFTEAIFLLPIISTTSKWCRGSRRALFIVLGQRRKTLEAGATASACTDASEDHISRSGRKASSECEWSLASAGTSPLAATCAGDSWVSRRSRSSADAASPSSPAIRRSARRRRLEQINQGVESPVASGFGMTKSLSMNKSGSIALGRCH